MNYPFMAVPEINPTFFRSKDRIIIEKMQWQTLDRVDMELL